jgi:hypothetical protein
MKYYWWIKNLKTGKLAQHGRSIHDDGSIWECGMPYLFYRKHRCKKCCRKGEIPVRVKLVEVK